MLIDGGATNPLPFDALRGRADVIVAVDISGAPTEERRDMPNPWECLATTVLVMGSAITDEKLKHGAPDLMVRPNVGIVPHARLPAGQRHPARGRAGQGRGEDAGAGAA